MDTSEYIIEQKLVTASAKCSLFGPKQYVYFYLFYTSKANWELSTDTPHYDPNCKCYQKDLNKLFSIEIAQAKKEILNNIRIKHTLHKMSEINKLKVNKPIKANSTPNLMKHKDIKIKEVDWRD